MYIIKFFFIISLLFSTQLLANGQVADKSKSLEGWVASSYPVQGKITKIKGKKDRKNILSLEGEGTKSSYIYTFSKSSREFKELTWEMLYEEDFVILLDVNTLHGKRSFIYTASSTHNHLQFGLGEHSISSEWIKQTRDLEHDLKQYEPNNELLGVHKFVIRGSGLVTNIALLQQKKSLTSKVKIKSVRSVKKVKNEKITLPVISILGHNPIVLKKGEAYVEAGAIARDIDGSKLVVNISHDINSHEDGEYTVIYMATNSIGNSAVDRRVVKVGKTRSKNKYTLEGGEEEFWEPPEDDLVDKESYDYPVRPGL